MTIALVVLVALVWGIIALKVIKSIDRTGDLPRVKVKYQRRISGGEFDKYNLSKYARDPFLSILSDTASIDVIPEPIKPKPSTQVPLPLFCGLISGEDGKDVAIFKHRNKYLHLKKGQRSEDIHLLSIGEKSVVIKIGTAIYTLTNSGT